MLDHDFLLYFNIYRPYYLIKCTCIPPGLPSGILLALSMSSRTALTFVAEEPSHLPRRQTGYTAMPDLNR